MIKSAPLRALLLGGVLLCAGVHAMPVIKIGFPESIPPWVNAGNQPGIAIELLQETLKAEGLMLKPVFQPYARRLQAYRHGTLDGLYDISPSQQHAEQLGGSISRPLHSFDNIAIALSRRAPSIEHTAELGKWRVLAWEGASSLLPASYDQLEAVANGRYHEIADQQKQVRSLFSGRTDVILSDRLIFEWYRRQLKSEITLDTSQPVHIYAVLPPSETGILLHDSALRARLDNRIKALKASPRYQAVFSRYGYQPQP